ncbi:MAG: hypothetical protein LKF36_12805 [Lactobacillus sp.]|jgi:hypothetical protein|nr:hypothetical protein [Lactobacillus sp.]
MAFKPYLFAIIGLFGLTYGFALILQWLLDRAKIRLGAAFGIRGALVFGFLGLWIHELSHAGLALLFRHKITDMKLMELHPSGQEITLGHVTHTYNKRSPYQAMGNFFIGLGPIIGCSGVILIALWVLLPATFTDLINLVVSLTQQFDVNALGIAISGLVQSMPINIHLFIFLLILVETAFGFGLSRADLSGSLLGLPYIVLLVVLLSVADYFWNFHWLAFLIQLDVLLGIMLSLVLLISICYSLLIYLITAPFV